MTEGLKVGDGVSFWHEGGRGERRWVIGWRFGFIRKIEPGRIRIEIRTYKRSELVWVPSVDVNAPGDTTYHGPRALDVAQEREDEKAAEQAKADKIRNRGRRFHR